MNKVFAKIIGLVVMATVAVFSFAGCDKEAVTAFITPKVVSTVAEYGTYFGSKAGGLSEKDAKIIETSLEAIIKILDSNSINEVVDISSKIEDLPDVAKTYLGEAISIVDKNFVKVKGKIPADKVPYVKAVFSGGLKGIQKYIASIQVVAVNSGYETELANRYSVAKKVIK